MSHWLLADDAEIFMSFVSLGELIYGARKSTHVERNLDRLNALRSVCPIVCGGETTASHYGSLKERLRAKGRPIPENDLWIAALALEHGLTLLTQDRHFEALKGTAGFDARSW
jgi:tRNA(fMet)-specific endonuclease VapC